MSHPQPGDPSTSPPPTRPSRQEELLQGIGRDLVAVLPEGWYRADLRFFDASVVSDTKLAVLMRDGGRPYVDAPPSVIEAARELRGLSYREGPGTWFSLRYLLDPPTRYTVVFNHDFDPMWNPEIPAEVWRTDLEVYPRDEEHTPEWLRAKLTEGES